MSLETHNDFYILSDEFTNFEHSWEKTIIQIINRYWDKFKKYW